MAYTRNTLMKKTSGHIDKQIVFKSYAGKTVISKYPDMSKVKRTPKQELMNRLMAHANDESRMIMLDDKLKMEAQVRLNVTSNKLYNALVKEFFTNYKEGKIPAEKIKKWLERPPLPKGYGRKYV
jgi:hypothetical protein